MTETSPACTAGMPKPQLDVLPQRIDYKTRAGRCVFGVDMRIVDDDGTPLPFDGVAQGEIHVRGPWIASSYFEDEEATARGITPDGWLRTGDIATIDADGYVMIRDRVAEAAVIGVPHPTWSERPVLFVVAKQGDELDAASILVVAELPHTATGKVSKRNAARALRRDGERSLAASMTLLPGIALAAVLPTCASQSVALQRYRAAIGRPWQHIIPGRRVSHSSTHSTACRWSPAPLARNERNWCSTQARRYGVVSVGFLGMFGPVRSLRYESARMTVDIGK